MKKKMMVGITATTMALAMNMTALAGQWQSDANGWWYQNDDGSYSINTWQWIDGNNDGVAESYYFDGKGYCLMNTTTPDGYAVNPAGAWVVNGIVQTKAVGTTPNTVPEVSNIAPLNLLDTEPASKGYCWDFANGKTAQGELWSSGLELQTWVNDAYVEYFSGGKYKQFSFTIAPNQGMKDNTHITARVYGDDDSLLWTSDTITYKSSSKDITVDISNQQYVKIFVEQTGNMGATVLVKNLQFK